MSQSGCRALSGASSRQPSGHGLLSKAGALGELGKLRLSSLAIFAVLAGLYLGSPAPAPVLVAATTVGTLLVAMAGNAFNMLIERELDRRMDRTRARPLPSGRLTPAAVWVFGASFGGGGLVLLAWATNAVATALCGAIFVSYVLVYTPLKRVTTLNTLVGAVPGALPPVVGYAAGAGVVDLRAGILFLILFFWQIPHFLAIAWRYRHDYARSGMRMLSVVDPEGRATAQQMLLYTAALVVVSLLPYGARMSGEAYLGAAICLDVLFTVPVLVAAVLRRDSAMRMAFTVSLVYLPLLLGIMVLDRSPG